LQFRSEAATGFYFAALADFAVFAAADRALSEALAGCLRAVLAGMFNDARRAWFLSRLAACDRLRVFSRAFSFGMGAAPWGVENLPLSYAVVGVYGGNCGQYPLTTMMGCRAQGARLHK
jgi:hypothetical protein